MTADMSYLNLLAAEEAAALMRGFTTVATPWADRPSASSGPSTKASWRAAHLSLGRLHLGRGTATLPGSRKFREQLPEPRRADRRGSHHRQSDEDVRLRAGEPHAGRQPDQAHGGRRSVVTLRSARHDSIPKRIMPQSRPPRIKGTYANRPPATPRSIDQAGDRCRSSAAGYSHLLDEATARLMATKGIWLSLQPFLDDEDANPVHSPAGRRGSWK